MFPPARKSIKSSKAWEFCKTGQLKAEQSVYGLCGKAQKYKNTPTNLQQHVKAEHSGEKKTSLKETKLDNYFLTKPSMFSKR